jgi:restriction system protein
MAEITPTRIGELLKFVFAHLRSHPEGLSAMDILSHIQEAARLTDFESGYPVATPGIPRYETIIRLASISLVRVGWLEKNATGRWFITEVGWKASQQFPEPGEFYNESARLYKEFCKKRRGRSTAFLAVEDAREDSWDQICDFLQELEPSNFKIMVCELLRAMGYAVIWITPPEESGLIDLVAHSDSSGSSLPRLIVQVKHKGQALTVEGLKSFTSVLNPNDIGLLVSSGGFTKEVETLASTLIERTISLVDLKGFYDLWVKHYGQISPEGRARLPLESVYFLSPFD